MKLLSQICDELGGKENENDDLDRRCPFFLLGLWFSQNTVFDIALKWWWGWKMIIRKFKKPTSNGEKGRDYQTEITFKVLAYGQKLLGQ